MTGEELRTRRERLGLSQSQLAVALHRSVDTIQNWEQGRRAIEWPGVLRFLLEALDRERTMYGADREGFIAALSTFLERDRP